MNIIVSACLLGINCKYDGLNNRNEKVVSLMDKHNLIPVCPEQFGGLKTPRIPSEICKNRVKNKNGDDVTAEYEKGAEETLKIAKLLKCGCAVLKERSPSCGVRFVYDGSFSKKLINGSGVTAKKLMESGIKIYSEENVDELL